MISGRNKIEQRIIEKVYRAEQEHVFRFLDKLSDTERDALFNQLDKIDFSLINDLYNSLIKDPRETTDNADLEPADYIPVPATEKEKEYTEKARKTGEQALLKGRVAAFLVAGGQGTRLGFNGPKGCFPVSPVKNKTLFQIHAEKILAASKKYGVVIPWYIMTSQANHNDTVNYFEDNNYLGLNKQDVMFFKQEMLPAVDKNGKIIMDSENHIFMSPNGHGGSFSALLNSGAVTDMKKRNIDIISYFQVDNVLVKIIDPVFIGYHIMQNSEMSSKMAVKAFPEEKVGVFCIRNNKLTVIEYSDLSKEQMYARNADNSLKFKAGSIAIHLINRDFVVHNMKQGLTLPFHVAHKKIPYIDNEGIKITPDKPNGYKFETFVFDALSRTTSSVIMEIKREEEFSPVKNREGTDSAETAKQDMSDFFGNWLEKAGISVPKDSSGNVKIPVEISPLFAIDFEEFEKKCPDNIKTDRPLYIGPEE